MGVPKNFPQGKEEMMESAMLARESRLYKSDKSRENSESIGETVGRLAAELRTQADREGKVSLKDTTRVMAIAHDYLDTCQQCGCLPTVTGLARALGVHRNALYWHLNNRADKTAEFLQDFSELCAEATAEAALNGSVQPVVAIFSLKARYSWKDTISVETASRENPLGGPVDVEAIAEKYRELPED